MKSFAIDEKPIDIEELAKLKCLNNCSSMPSCGAKKVHIIKDDSEWYCPKTMDDLFALLNEYANVKYKVLFGNTGVGVFKNDGPYKVFIDLKSIDALYSLNTNAGNLTIGAGQTLKSLIDIFTGFCPNIGFEYLNEIANHLAKIANKSIRCAGTWSGNLVMKYLHKDFPSDVFVCLETINASVCLVGPNKTSPPVYLTPLELMQLPNLNGKIIYSLNLKPLSESTIVKTYKIMPRSQNAHAYINAGFRFDIDGQTLIIKSRPTIVFGGLSATFIHANKTEEYLNGKPLNNQKVVATAFLILKTELEDCEYNPVLSSVAYRKSLSLALFYKFILFVNQRTVPVSYLSAIESLIETRQVSSGMQVFQTLPSLYPITKPISKLNEYLQTSGEASYVYDMPMNKHDLNAAFIVTNTRNCRLARIDTSEALKIPGVKAILFARDIPGNNSFLPPPMLPELLFADDLIDYAGQAVGLVIADTFEQANTAAKLVDIVYIDKKPPILSIEDAIRNNSFFPNPPEDFVFGNAELVIKQAPNVIEGDCSLGILIF